jgi:hypothetical protein
MRALFAMLSNRTYFKEECAYCKAFLQSSGKIQVTKLLAVSQDYDIFVKEIRKSFFEALKM